jgi:hypothetical protein
MSTWIPAALAIMIGGAGYAIVMIVFVVTWYGQTDYAATRRWRAINRATRRVKVCSQCDEPGTVWQTVDNPSWFVGTEPPGWWRCAEHAEPPFEEPTERIDR